MTEDIEAGVALEPAAGTLFGHRDPSDVLEEAGRVAGLLRTQLSDGGMIVRIAGSETPSAEGCQLLGTLYGLSTRVVWSRPRDDGWEARAEVVDASGLVRGAGESMCSRSERSWARRDEYAIRSMAQTRASTRALRSVLGFTMKMSGVDGATEDATVVEPPPWARPTEDIRPVAEALAGILTIAGVPEADKAMVELGRRIKDRCDGSFPVCVRDALNDLHGVLLAASRRDG